MFSSGVWPVAKFFTVMNDGCICESFCVISDPNLRWILHIIHRIQRDMKSQCLSPHSLPLSNPTELM